MAPQPNPPVVLCPQCRAPVEWGAENRFRPFCSERCKLIDLGAWASEQYRIAVPDESRRSDNHE